MTQKPKLAELTLCQGVEGQCVYLNDLRIAGAKPWGGGRTIKTWQASLADILRALDVSVEATPSPGSESQIPAGWRLYSANFKNPKRPGKVTICRDAEGMAWWNKLNAYQMELAELYLHGRGSTLNEAIADAVTKIGGLTMNPEAA